jgi:hypothetical protein
MVSLTVSLGDRISLPLYFYRWQIYWIADGSPVTVVTQKSEFNQF